MAVVFQLAAWSVVYERMVLKLLCWMQSMHHLLCIGTTKRKTFQSEVTNVAEGKTSRVHHECEGQDLVV